MIFRTVFLLSFCAAIFLAYSKELRTVPRKKVLAYAENHSHKLKTQNAVALPSNPTYAIFYGYDDPACTEQVQAESYLLDTCFAGDTYSNKYTCSGGVVTRTTYSDLTCTTQFGGTDIRTIGACNVVDVTFSAKAVACGVSAYDYGNGDFVSEVTYQDSACASSPVLETIAIFNNECYYDGTTGTFKWNWPTKSSYNSADCTGTATTSTSNPCTAEGTFTDDLASYNAYSNNVHVSNFAPRSMHMGVAAVVSLLLAIVTLV